MNRVLIILLIQIVFVDSFPRKLLSTSGSGSGSGSGSDVDSNLNVSTTPIPITTNNYITPNSKRGVDYNAAYTVITIVGILFILCVVLPLIRTKNLCYLGTCCNKISYKICRTQGCCTGCDDCCTESECECSSSESSRHQGGTLDLCCACICHCICHCICKIINLFSCPYEESYVLYRANNHERWYNTTPKLSNDPEYYMLKEKLNKFDRKQFKEITANTSTTNIVIEEQPKIKQFGNSIND